MKLTWSEARDAIIEPTEIGWTLKSCDRIWLVVAVEDRQEPGSELAAYNGNWLFYADDYSSYELWDKELCFTSRREAEAFIATIPEKYRHHWHPLNLGDDLRRERAYFGEHSGKPKFKGSQVALDLKAQAIKKYWGRP